MEQSEVDEIAEKLMPGWAKMREKTNERNKITIPRLQELVGYFESLIEDMEKHDEKER